MHVSVWQALYKLNTWCSFKIWWRFTWRRTFTTQPPQHHSPETKAAEEINSSETSRTFQSNSSPTNHAVNWQLTVCICTTNLLLDAKDVCVSMRTFGWLVMSWQEVTRSVCFCFGVFAGSLIGLRPLTDLVPTHLPTSGLCDKAE